MAAPAIEVQGRLGPLLLAAHDDHFTVSRRVYEFHLAFTDPGRQVSLCVGT
jgi:hypothetical protein